MRVYKHVYNKNEDGGPWWKTAQWTIGLETRKRYVGTVLKGWWTLERNSITRHFEVELALGGEDNMLQFGIVLPFIGCWHIGVRVPRSLTRSWIYQRREWTIRVGYIGRWFELLVAYDDSAADMHSYYKAKRKHGESLDPWSRVALWPGLHLSLRPRPLDFLLGRSVCTVDKGESQPTVVPMPEGNYAATVTKETRTWKRPRWPWSSRVRVDYWLEISGGIPVPGKGENSYDCEDDGIYGGGGVTVTAAIGSMVSSVLRLRQRHGGRDWEPDAGWTVGRSGGE